MQHRVFGRCFVICLNHPFHPRHPWLKNPLTAFKSTTNITDDPDVGEISFERCFFNCFCSARTCRSLPQDRLAGASFCQRSPPSRDRRTPTDLGALARGSLRPSSFVCEICLRKSGVVWLARSWSRIRTCRIRIFAGPFCSSRLTIRTKAQSALF
jgi:hypothetical protein